MQPTVVEGLPKGCCSSFRARNCIVARRSASSIVARSCSKFGLGDRWWSYSGYNRCRRAWMSPLLLGLSKSSRWRTSQTSKHGLDRATCTSCGRHMSIAVLNSGWLSRSSTTHTWSPSSYDDVCDLSRRLFDLSSLACSIARSTTVRGTPPTPVTLIHACLNCCRRPRCTSAPSWSLHSRCRSAARAQQHASDA